MGDDKIEDPSDLSEAISERKPKDEVKITYKRDGKEKTVNATLQERNGSDLHSYSFVSPRGGMKTITVPGAHAAPRNFSRGYDYEFDELFVMGRPKLGLKIEDLEEGSAAEKAGIKKDDVITSVGDVKVENTDDAREELHKNAEKPTYTIEAKRNGSPMKFDIKIPKKLNTANL